jgi:hypothetical protein
VGDAVAVFFDEYDEVFSGIVVDIASDYMFPYGVNFLMMMS